MEIKPTVENVFSLSDDYWDMCLQKFVALIKSKYDEENIIINEFCFADEYIDTDGTKKQFEYLELYHNRGILTQKIANKLKTLMPCKAMVISPYENPLGDAKHSIGLSPMHYIPDVYIAQNKKLEQMLKV